MDAGAGLALSEQRSYSSLVGPLVGKYGESLKGFDIPMPQPHSRSFSGHEFATGDHVAQSIMRQIREINRERWGNAGYSEVPY